MKRPLFIFIFFGTQFLFVVLQIHKHTLITRLSYLKQKRETIKLELCKQKQELINQWYQVSDRSTVKQFAEQELHLQPMKLSQVKKISHDKQTVQN